ncbi:MAG: DinB family protein [Chlorobi bacterium]|nr:DinB family protein [Chlorobiota bacterium]
MDLKQAARNILEDVILYLQQLDDVRYKQQLEVFSGSSVGMHTRHIIEFYQCLIDHGTSRIINYDKRERNRAIEEDTSHTISVIHDLLEKLAHINEDDKLILEVSYELENGGYSLVDTNFKRELVYNLEHTIHHLALVKIGLKEIAPEILLPAHFGVAPSTIKFKKQFVKNL